MRRCRASLPLVADRRTASNSGGNRGRRDWCLNSVAMEKRGLRPSLGAFNSERRHELTGVGTVEIQLVTELRISSLASCRDDKGRAVET
jgi:hypothetical protein